MKIEVPEVMEINDELKRSHELYAQPRRRVLCQQTVLLARKFSKKRGSIRQLFTSWGWDTHADKQRRLNHLGLRNKCAGNECIASTALLLDYEGNEDYSKKRL